MITDDPGTPGNGNWEINVADIATLAREQYYNLIPYFDINYGAGDRVQLKAEGGFGQSQEPGAAEYKGLGSMLFGVKWRYWDQDQDGLLSASLYPQFGLGTPFTQGDPQFETLGNYWLLPLEFSKHWGPYAVNPEIGYQYNIKGANGWFYGVVGDYEPRKDFELLAELYGDAEEGSGDTDLLFNIGTRYPFSEHVLLLASAGHTLRTLPGLPAQYLAFLGVQLLY